MHPTIIQGGMGIGVSGWKLARAVSACGELGVVSGTCIDTVFIRRLQDGDAGGHLRRAMKHFPRQDVALAVLKKYFKDGGRKKGQPYKLLPLFQRISHGIRDLITVLASFTEVFLAKEGHLGVVGINLLTKIQMPTLATLYGALLAQVDYVLMGAGVPKEIPQALQQLANHETSSITLDLPEKGEAREILQFSPLEHFEDCREKLKKPYFFPIVSAHSLVGMLLKKSNGTIDGFVVENYNAGGHNAPPRDRGVWNEAGEPVYGKRDEVDTNVMRELGVPFWLAGSMGTREKLDEAKELGAQGIQVGTLFALCQESGISPELRMRVLEQVRQRNINVKTDPNISPTSYPFKVLELSGTLTDPEVYSARKRICDLGYLRSAYRKKSGNIGFRCPGEPVADYLKKGGNEADTKGKMCLCNCLLSTVGLGQVREKSAEPPLVTSGGDLDKLADLLPPLSNEYSAQAVIQVLRGERNTL